MTTPAWIGQREAAEILGVHVSAVAKMVARGELLSRGTRRKSLDRDAVLSLRDARMTAANAKETAAAQRERQRERDWQHEQASSPDPPDNEHPWISTHSAAQLMGVTPTAISQRARRGRLPCVEHQGRRWFRPDLLALVKNADQARRRWQRQRP